MTAAGPATFSRAPHPPLIAALLVVALVLGGAPLSAQRVTFSGRGDPEVDRRISAALAGAYKLLERDTTIAARDTLQGPVLATGITLRLQGVIVGDLIGVASDLFIHPRGVVTGEVLNAGGGLYPSALSTVGGIVDRPLANYTATRTDTAIAIRARTPGKSIIDPDGLYGLVVPTYDRVNGLWPQAGAALRLPVPPALDSLLLHGLLGWRTGGPGFTHTVDLQARRGHYTLMVGFQRLSTTEDDWIRGDVSNSLSFLVRGNDYRDYYDARRVFAILARDFESGRWLGHFALRGNREVDRSLSARDTWVMFGPDSMRPNPSVRDATLASGVLEAAALWTGAGSTLTLGAELESAGRALEGELSFNRYSVWGAASLLALWGHTLGLRWNVRGPLPGTDSLPRQRWSHVGGGATLPTFPIAAFPGDRVVFVATEYVVPLPQAMSLPLVGVPSIALVHAAGMGWTADQSQKLEQNLGVELRSYGFALQLMTNPAHARRDARFAAGFSFDAGRAPVPRPHFDTRAAVR